MPRPAKPKAPPKLSFVSLKFCTSGMTAEEVASYTSHFHATIRARDDLAEGCRVFLHTYEDPLDQMRQ